MWLDFSSTIGLKSFLLLLFPSRYMLHVILFWHLIFLIAPICWIIWVFYDYWQNIRLKNSWFWIVALATLVNVSFHFVSQWLIRRWLLAWTGGLLFCTLTLRPWRPPVSMARYVLWYRCHFFFTAKANDSTPVKVNADASLNATRQLFCSTLEFHKYRSRFRYHANFLSLTN